MISENLRSSSLTIFGGIAFFRGRYVSHFVCCFLNRSKNDLLANRFPSSLSIYRRYLWDLYLKRKEVLSAGRCRRRLSAHTYV